MNSTFPSPTRAPHFRLVLAAAAALSAASAFAQEPTGKPAAPKSLPEPTVNSRPDLPRKTSHGPQQLISVEFTGGTVKEFVDAVHKAGAPNEFNVLLPREAGGVVCPAVSLKNVSVETALGCLRWLFAEDSEDHFDVASVGADTDGAATFMVRYRGRAGRTMPEVALNQTRPGSRGGTPNMMSGDPRMNTSGAPLLEIFSLRDLMVCQAGGDPGAGQAAVSRVLSAADTALDMQARAIKDGGGGGEPAQVKFHPDSGTLIVRGTPEQISIIKNLLDTMRRDAEHQAVQTEALREAEFQMQKTSVALEQSMKDVQVAEVERDQAKQRFEAGNASTDELNKASARLDRVKSQARMTQVEMEHAASIIQLHRSQLGAGGPGGAGDPGAGLDEGNVDSLRKHADEIRVHMKALQDRLAHVEDAIRKLEKERGAQPTPKPAEKSKEKSK